MNAFVMLLVALGYEYMSITGQHHNALLLWIQHDSTVGACLQSMHSRCWQFLGSTQGLHTQSTSLNVCIVLCFIKI